MIVYGINPALEALRAGAVSRLWARAGAGGRVARVAARASRAGIAVQRLAASELDRLASGAAHQGVVAEVAGPAPSGVQDLVRNAAAAPLVAVLDGVEDPRNFGAVARAAEAAGADGLIFQTRRSASPGATAARASAGALAHLRLAPVVNISRALETLARAGVWTVGLDAGAERSCFSLDLTQPTAFVFGAEGARVAPSGARALRLAGVDPDARPGLQPQRCGGRRHRPVRGRAAADGCRREVRDVEKIRRTGRRCATLSSLSGWRSSVR